MTALKELRVLDVTQYEAGPSCTQALAWFGADVVKVEPPGRGDPGRGGDIIPQNYFLQWNSNKRSVAIDLTQEQGRQLLLEMAPTTTSLSKITALESLIDSTSDMT